MTAPKFPNAKSLEGVALAMILSGIKISHLNFQDDTRSYCLRHPIYKLIAAGWPIEDEVIAGGISVYSGRRIHYKIYFINSDELAKLKKELDATLDNFVADFGVLSQQRGAA